MIDWVSRVVRKDTIVDAFWEGYERGETFQELNKRIKCSSYLHSPTREIVRIMGIEEDYLVTHAHPDPRYSDWIDFYKKNYGLEVKDHEQWLAYAYGSTRTETVDGKVKRVRERIYYVPEFLQFTGLTNE